MFIKPLILIVFGVSLLIIGLNMKNAEVRWDETVITHIVKPGTKSRNATIGGGAGAVVGGVVAVAVGGVGVVVAGTGFGLPAGLALIATAATIGASAGAVTGAAIGDSSSTDTVTETIPHIDPVYESWKWRAVLFIAAILFVAAILQIYKISTQPSANKPKSDI